MITPVVFTLHHDCLSLQGRHLGVTPGRLPQAAAFRVYIVGDGQDVLEL